MTTIRINGNAVTIDGDNIDIQSRGDQIIINGSVVGRGLSGTVNLDLGTAKVGSVRADGSVTCGDVGGNVNAGGSCRCNNVNGSVNAGGSVTASGNAAGNISAGGSVRINRN